MKNLFCSLPPVSERIFDASVDANRARAILNTSKKWANGTVLKYYFFQNWNRTAKQEEVVRKAFGLWKAVGIGLIFEEVNSALDADIRIGFLHGDGSWSYVGRDIWSINKSQRTTNFGWDISPADELDTAIHEIGHTLGFYHEHQNPNAGIVWNEEAVYEALSKPPNSWDRQKTYNNIIKKLDPNDVQGSDWDPNSVMHYPFEPGLIDQPVQFRDGVSPAGGLSQKDKETVKRFYPLLGNKDYRKLNLMQSVEITAQDGEQQNFIFEPKHSKNYKIQTFGEMDTLLVLFEEDADGELHFLAGDDDSGTDHNAFIKTRLLRKRKYIIRVRVMYRAGDMGGGIVVS